MPPVRAKPDWPARSARGRPVDDPPGSRSGSPGTTRCRTVTRTAAIERFAAGAAQLDDNERVAVQAGRVQASPGRSRASTAFGPAFAPRRRVRSSPAMIPSVTGTDRQLHVVARRPHRHRDGFREAPRGAPRPGSQGLLDRELVRRERGQRPGHAADRDASDARPMQVLVMCPPAMGPGWGDLDDDVLHQRLIALGAEVPDRAEDVQLRHVANALPRGRS